MSEEEPILNWRPLAACLGVDPGLFFPQRGQSVAEAKAICDGCAVSYECLMDAIRLKEPAGVRGGLAAHARRQFASQFGLNDPKLWEVWGD